MLMSSVIILQIKQKGWLFSLFQYYYREKIHGGPLAHLDDIITESNLPEEHKFCDEYTEVETEAIGSTVQNETFASITDGNEKSTNMNIKEIPVKAGIIVVLCCVYFVRSGTIRFSTGMSYIAAIYLRLVFRTFVFPFSQCPIVPALRFMILATSACVICALIRAAFSEICIAMFIIS